MSESCMYKIYDSCNSNPVGEAAYFGLPKLLIVYYHGEENDEGPMEVRQFQLDTWNEKIDPEAFLKTTFKTDFVYKILTLPKK